MPAAVLSTKTSATPAIAQTYHKPEPLDGFDFHGNWKINWRHFPVIVCVPILGMIGAFFTKLQTPTFIWAVVYYFITGLGITAGHHRYWSHRTYQASLPLQIFLAACATASIQGSILWWCQGHRAHHRYTDTNKDPYSVHRGLLWSHIGWLLVIEPDKPQGKVDVSDLTSDPLVMWQNRHFDIISPIIALGFPCLVAGLGWGDWVGGFLYAGVLRLAVVHHATFSVNSLAHYLGDQPYDDRSAKDSMVTAFATLGEGYHNFHHAFPTDYRNAIHWYQYDPTKWIITVYKALGLASDLSSFSDNEIQKGMIQTSQKRLDEWNAKINWGRPTDELPVIEIDDYKQSAKTKPLILISGMIYDVTNFIERHPGGRKMMASAIGKDATALFNGGVYNHSRIARNLLDDLRVGIVRGGMEVEIFTDEYIQDRKTIIMDDKVSKSIVEIDEISVSSGSDCGSQTSIESRK